MNLGYGSERDANNHNSKPDRKHEEEVVWSEEFYRADRPHRNAVHGRETVVARHVPAAMHGFATLGPLILSDAIIFKRRVQVDMGQ